MMSMNLPPCGLTAAEQDRVIRFGDAMTRLLAQNWITARMGWVAYIKGSRRMLGFGRFEIEDAAFATISDYDLFGRVQLALAG
jgi:hypothetical protein